MTGFLADDLYFTMNDPYTGKARMPAGQLGTCLAAALLCELMLDDQVRLVDGALALVERPPPDDELGRVLLERLQNLVYSKPQSIADWLRLIRPTAVDLVVERLVRTGAATQAQRRRLGRGSSVVVSTDPAGCEVRADRLAAYLRNQITPSLPETVIAALVILGGPKPDPLAISATSRALVAGLTPQLPADLQQVLIHGERVLTAWR